nr:hypothetical protein [Blautia sp. Marseille-P3201T]
MEERFMLLELLLEDERREGQLKMAKEMLEMTLSRLGRLPNSLLETLHQQQDIERLKAWMQTALTAQSLDEFISKM